jgi:small neutral amino acid transporter SnatA (MarC family)
MNALSLAVLGLAVVNPARVRLLLGARSAKTRRQAALGGVLAALIVAVVLGALATPLIDALEIAPETFRIAAGMVITLAALITLAVPPSQAEALRGGPTDGLVPVAYPILLGPATVMTWLVTGVDRGVLPTLGIAALGYGVAAALAGVPEGRRSGWLAAARLAACALVLMGVALVIDGVREV